MTTYTDTIKLDSLPLFEPTTGFKPVTKLDSLPLFEPTTGFKPVSYTHLTLPTNREV